MPKVENTGSDPDARLDVVTFAGSKDRQNDVLPACGDEKPDR